MEKYVSLIIDIENSRGYNVDARNDVQKFVIKCVNYLNQAFENSLEFEMTFSAGDEIQGLFHNLTTAILYMRIFEMMIRPVKIRAGIGVGEWIVKIEGGSSTQQDGPVYHRARQAIVEVEKKQTQRYRIISDGEDELINYLLNTSCVLKEQQGYMQNIAQIVVELLYPFEKRGMLRYHYDIIKELLIMKYRYRIGDKYLGQDSRVYQRGTDIAEELDNKVLKVIEPIYIDGMNFDSEEEIVKRGMSSEVAEVMGCRRQNADKLLKRGHTVAVRNMDYIALQYIEKEYRQYDI